MAATNAQLTRFGFNFEHGSPHTSRTMMWDELDRLLAAANRPDTSRADYLRAIRDENCLGKRSGKNRLLTARHLVRLYSLDSAHVLFRALLFFWRRDEAGRPVLALLCAYARDSVLRAAAPFILQVPEGAAVSREALERHIDGQTSGRFSEATLRSTAQNINATWTQSGHLRGRARKTRARAVPTPGSAAYALLLGLLSGARGMTLFQSEFAALLDCPCEDALELAAAAARRGWLTFRRIGDVVEVSFPHLFTQEEMEWLHE